jgi:hypothetical protein
MRHRLGSTSSAPSIETSSLGGEKGGCDTGKDVREGRYEMKEGMK